MATDIAAFKAALVNEKIALQASIGTIDMNDETVRFNQAQSAFQTAKDTFQTRTRRWAMVNDKISRLEEVDRQIAYLTSLGF